MWENEFKEENISEELKPFTELEREMLSNESKYTRGMFEAIDKYNNFDDFFKQVKIGFDNYKLIFSFKEILELELKINQYRNEYRKYLKEHEIIIFFYKNTFSIVYWNGYSQFKRLDYIWFNNLSDLLNELTSCFNSAYRDSIYKKELKEELKMEKYAFHERERVREVLKNRELNKTKSKQEKKNETKKQFDIIRNDIKQLIQLDSNQYINNKTKNIETITDESWKYHSIKIKRKVNKDGNVIVFGSKINLNKEFIGKYVKIETFSDTELVISYNGKIIKNIET